MRDLEEFIAICEANASPDDEIDTSDIPEMSEKDFARGRFRYFKPVKESVTVRVDRDILAWLKENGEGYETRLNAVLSWAREHDCPIDKL